MKVGEEVLLALEAKRQAEEEDRLQLKYEEEAHINKEARMDS